MTTDTAHLIESLRSVIAPGSTHLDVRLSRPDIVALLGHVDGLWGQHGRDSSELRRLCGERDKATRALTRANAEANVLRALLRLAGKAIETIEPPHQAEAAGMLDELKTNISAAVKLHPGIRHAT